MATDEQATQGRYETPTMLRNYLLAQYGPFLEEPTHLFEEFTTQALAIASKFIREGTRAIDIGCATGRLAIEYAKLGAQCTGTDSSDTFIAFCEFLKSGGISDISYPIPEASVDFLRDDICTSTLPSNSFDFVSCLNVLDRVPEPQAAIASIERITAPGGIACVSLPYDWEFSPAPKERHFSDIKSLLAGDRWHVLHEQMLPYRIPTGEDSYRDYESHLVVTKHR